MAPKRKSTVHSPAKTKGGNGPLTTLPKGNFGVPSPNSDNSKATTNAYTLNFEDILANHSITRPNPSKPPDNVDEWKKRMKQERSNRKLENFTAAQFLEFQNISQDSRIENQVMRYIYPYFRESAKQDGLHSAQQNRPCKNWRPLIPPPSGAKTQKNPLVIPQPDLWDGLRKQKYRKLRKALYKWIVPANRRSPSLSNFFGEFKSPRGTAACAIRQACYDGALGARGMHKAQNLGKEGGKEVYDNNAYTISFWYGSGSMNAYLHWKSPPKFAGDEIPYNMYLVGQWALIADIEDFRRGITAFRNARDMAYEFRVLFAKKATRKLDRSSKLADNLNLDCQPSSYDSSQNDDDDDSSDDGEGLMNDSSDEDGPSEEEGPDSDDDGEGEEEGVDDEDDDEEEDREADRNDDEEEDSEADKNDEDDEETEGEDTETEHVIRKGKIGRRHGMAPQFFDGASSTDSNCTEDNVQPPRKRQRGSPVPSAPAPGAKPGPKAKVAEQATANAKSKKTPKGKARAEDELDPKMAMLAKGYGSSQ